MESLGLRATAAPGFFVCCRRNERKEKWCVFLLLLQNKVNKGKNIVLFVAEREIFLYLCYCFNAGSIRRLPLVSEMV